MLARGCPGGVSRHWSACAAAPVPAVGLSLRSPWAARDLFPLGKHLGRPRPQPEAEALTAKAAELIARYGIDRALLAARQPETDQPASKIIEITSAWARVQAHLLRGLAAAMRCRCVMLTGSGPGIRIHIFGFASDIERADILFTSLLVQMWQGLAVAEVPAWSQSPRAWRRSWLLGFATAVIARVRTAEQRAATQASHEDHGIGPGTDLVLADRGQIIRRTAELAYPRTRKTKVTATARYR